MTKEEIEIVKKAIEEYEKDNHWWFWISNKITDFENRLEKQERFYCCECNKNLKMWEFMEWLFDRWKYYCKECHKKFLDDNKV